eukprot:TRINITY_DN44585_c0_g1_i1.p1 TRINITY_DN44585_c0_g1~~TRINITY_DN44585_c0_g1_i1.p1  ORF type:complete len:295 (-),score=22.15 TRINITY_DN44585_c0_g1_i1:266-1150(-)
MDQGSFLFWIAFVSTSSCVLFAIVIIWYRRCSTTLMKCVLFLCLTDASIDIWEMNSCKSYLGNAGVCIDYDCNVHMPVLRTLQTADLLWCTSVALAIFLTVSRKDFGLFRYKQCVWLLAVLLSSGHWIAGLMGAYSMTESGYCEESLRISPDLTFMMLVCSFLCFNVVIYVRSISILSQMSNSVVLQRTLHRALGYVSICVICVLPTVIIDACCDEGPEPLSFLSSTMYFLTGFCHVFAYGYHHWDISCWTRQDVGREPRVITFRADDSVSTAHASSALVRMSTDPYDLQVIDA